MAKGVPSPGVLHAISNDKTGSWLRAICEFIDNSFDADANRVFVGFPKPKELHLIDDGIGCSDLSKLYVMGERREHPSTDIGHYGYGCTQSMVWLWGTSKIVSRPQGCEGRSITIDWNRVASSQDWEYGEELIEPNAQFGTELYLQTCRPHPALDKIRSQISRIYSPAIERGKQILFSRGKARPMPLSRVPLPPLEFSIEDEFDVCGKRVSMKVGVVKEGEPNPFRGISFERTYRVIKDESALGAGDFGVARVAGRVHLSRDWRLTTNKDDFTELEDELGAAIYTRCRNVFESAASQCFDIEFASFNRELDAILNETLKLQKEKRDKPDDPQQGSVVPKETGRRRRKAKQVQSGEGSIEETSSGTGAKPRGGFKVEWLSLEGNTVGDYDDSACRVRLNLDNPWMIAMRKERNAWAIVSVIFLILADYNQRQADSKRPLFKSQDRALLTTLGSALVDAMNEPKMKLAGVA